MILPLAGLGATGLGAGEKLLVDLLDVPSLIVTIGTQYAMRGFPPTIVGTALLMDVPPPVDRSGNPALLRPRGAPAAHRLQPGTVHVFVFGDAGPLAGIAWIMHDISDCLATTPTWQAPGST